MKITDIKTYLVSPTGVFVKVETDEGISGFGEATINFHPQSVVGMIQDLKGYLIGEDPQRIEYLWQSMFRDLFMRGGPTHCAAISGIDMALWDIKGKYYNAPVYQLLGGLARDRVRLYGHIQYKSDEDVVRNVLALKEDGCTMIRFRGFHNMDVVRQFDYAKGVEEHIHVLALMRKTLGDDVDIIVECHGRYDLEWAIKMCKLAEPYRPFFIEDPIRQENLSLMAAIRQQTPLPLATGERSHNKWDFRELIANRLIDYARPDVCHCGGISEMKKIAAFAEVYGVQLVPHNTQGPLAYAACMHAAFSIDNVSVVEASFANPFVRINPKGTMFAKPWPTVENGYALPPKGPGLGVEVNEEALEEATANFVAPMQPRLRALDGSVRDW